MQSAIRSRNVKDEETDINHTKTELAFPIKSLDNLKIKFKKKHSINERLLLFNQAEVEASTLIY